jgi:hypothetical protein
MPNAAAIRRFDSPQANFSRSTSLIFRMDNLSVGIPRSFATWQMARDYPRLKIIQRHRAPTYPAGVVAIVWNAGRDRVERLVAIVRSRWSRSAGFSGRDHVECASCGFQRWRPADPADGDQRFQLIATSGSARTRSAFEMRRLARDWVPLA